MIPKGTPLAYRVCELWICTRTGRMTPMFETDMRGGFGIKDDCDALLSGTICCGNHFCHSLLDRGYLILLIYFVDTEFYCKCDALSNGTTKYRIVSRDQTFNSI